MVACRRQELAVRRQKIHSMSIVSRTFNDRRDEQENFCVCPLKSALGLADLVDVKTISSRYVRWHFNSACSMNVLFRAV